MTAAANGLPRPYGDSALAYRERGWLGVLPVPARSKKLKVEGWTGRDGVDPSGADVYEWQTHRPTNNVALRVPDTVVGLDIDAYKPEGQATLAAWITEHGPLPDTWRSTARDDGVSGIRWYTVPAGLEFAGQLSGGGIEIIQRSHRYAMVPPSVHPEGWTYRWYDPSGTVSLIFPAPTSFPALPDSWLRALTRTALDGLDKASITVDEVWEWLTGLPWAEAECCGMIRGEVDRTVKGFALPGRHDLLNEQTLKIIRDAVNGHAGVLTGLEELRHEFVASVTTSGEIRTTAEANSEWRRAVDGAARIVRANHPEVQPWCVCRPPFHPSLIEEAQRRRGESGVNGIPGNVTSDPPSATGEQSSWMPVEDWADAVAGRLSGVAPTQLARTDGPSIWYPGRINGLLGPSESGKSWIALLAVFQAIRVRGETVVILDFEDDQAGTAERLLALGLTPAELLAHVKYIRPDDPLDAGQMRRLMAWLAEVDPSLIVVDGLNAAMTLMGLDLLSNRDATSFYQDLLRPLALTGATVAYVDHTPKNDAEMASKGGIGAQAKRAMTTGAAIRVEVLEYFDRVHPGRLRLTVDKDRAGHVRRQAVSGVIGLVKVKPGGDGALTMRFDPVVSDLENFDVGMARVAKAVGLLDEPSFRAIREKAGMKQTSVREKLDQLIEGGWVSVGDGPNKALIHRLIRPYQGGVSAVSGYPRDTTPVGVSPTIGGDTRIRATRDFEEQGQFPDPADDPEAE